MNMIPVFVFAAGFALAVQAKSVGAQLRGLFKGAAGQPPQDLRAEEVLQGGDIYVRGVRILGALVCLGALAGIWMAVQAATGR